MPKYRYGCANCDRQWWEWASVADQLDVCPYCNMGRPTKLPVNFVVIQNELEEQRSAKENVVDHIEQNKEILKKLKRQAKNEDILNND